MVAAAEVDDAHLAAREGVLQQPLHRVLQRHAAKISGLCDGSIRGYGAPRTLCETDRALGGRSMYFLVFFIIPMLLGLAAQAWVRRSFAAGSQVQAASGMTGAQVSRSMLDSGGLSDVRIEGIGGSLSDHYDPRGKVMRLSGPVGQSNSVAAVAVAAHETGHAFQDARHEAGFQFRGRLAPAVGFASNAWFPLVLFGFFAN